MASTSRFTRVALVVNAASRTGSEAYDEAHRRLSELGVAPDVAYPVRDPARLGDVLDSVTADGCDLVVVGGGDGTLSTAIDHLARHDMALGVLPLGTANDLARTLQVPAEIGAACETIANGKLVDIDVGGMGDQTFCNVASIGLAVGVTRALTPGLKRRLGPLAYPVATMRAYRQHRPFTTYLDFPDGDHESIRVDDTIAVAIGNGRYYGGGNVISPDSGIDDHSLDVYVIPRGTARERIGVVRRVRDGSFVDHDHVIHVTTARIRLRADPEQPINLDGEVVASTPQEFVVHRNALDVLVPEDSTAAAHDG
ncbi:lipid kinase [Solicola gregarius]|uniref:Lipid kinase n=1 Tax=Solicola gregarius TaxID=2908642 RepID=A0AA46YN87_9ACTN|nr:lipid kinase [Solicola gregarius]UYM07349.1 lipid kinase [Solicola gregarius]